MGLVSRTYSPTDWQLWVYTPVAGKFRLDFSNLNGSDVLGGSSDTGSVTALPLRIGEIQIDEGQRPNQSVFDSLLPGTMFVTAQLLDWDSTTVAELYNGKQIFLTLKNEDVKTHPTFGANTVLFIGYINNLAIDVDPVSSITNLSIEAIDLLSAVVNYPLSLTKSTTTGKATQLANAFIDLSNANAISSYLSFSFTGSLASVYETNTFESKTIGEWIQDYIDSEVALSSSYYATDYSGLFPTVKKLQSFNTIYALTGGENLPESIVSSVTIGQDGGNVPTAFDLTNSTSNYTYGTASQNILSNPTIYSNSIDVPSAGLLTVANKIREYGQKIIPLSVTVKTAQAYQDILFVDYRPVLPGIGTGYYYPYYMWLIGQVVELSLTYTGETTKHLIVGSSHTIDVNGWQTTYQLLKGI